MKNGRDPLRLLEQRRRFLLMLAIFQTGTAKRKTLDELGKIDSALYHLGVGTGVQTFETR